MEDVERRVLLLRKTIDATKHTQKHKTAKTQNITRRAPNGIPGGEDGCENDSVRSDSAKGRGGDEGGNTVETWRGGGTSGTSYGDVCKWSGCVGGGGGSGGSGGGGGDMSRGGDGGTQM